MSKDLVYQTLKFVIHLLVIQVVLCPQYADSPFLPKKEHVSEREILSADGLLGHKRNGRVTCKKNYIFTMKPLSWKS
jgi:hypothetical protein